MQSTTDRIKEDAFKAAQQAQKQQSTSEFQQTPPNQSSPFNVIDGAAKLVADKLQEPFNNAVIANLCNGLQRYIGEQVSGVKPTEVNSTPNQVIEVFTSSQKKSFGAGNMYYLSSTSTTSTSVSLPINETSSSENSKGFIPKN